MVKVTSDSKISELWEKSGNQSFQKFKQWLLKKGFEFKGTQVKAVLDSKESVQVNRKFIPPSEFNTINASKIRDNFQVDIMVYNRREYRGFKYVLGCIDVHSRFAYCIPMTNRYAKTILEGFKKAFKVMGVPKNINMDNEFTSKMLKTYLEKEGVEVWYSFADEAYPNTKNSIIERFWRTLASLLQADRDRYKNWPQRINAVVTKYNNTYHDTIEAEPVEVWEGKAQSMHLRKYVDDDFSPGDVVRLLQRKETFAKDDEIKYSTALYELVRRSDKLVNRWVVRNLKTGKELKRPHMPRDFLLIKDGKAEKPKTKTTRGKTKDDEYVSKTKARAKTKKSLKELELSKGSVNYQKSGKRQRKPTQKLDM